MAQFDFVLEGKHWRAKGEKRQWAVGPLKQDKKSGKMVHDPCWFYASTEGMMKDLLESLVRTDPKVKELTDIVLSLKKHKDYLGGLYSAAEAAKEIADGGA